MKKISEQILQTGVHNLLSDPQIIFETVSGKRLQVLSPGRINPHEGPDFLDTAILLNGDIHVGDAEYHRKYGEWFAHGHDGDPRYKNVILHIVSSLDMNDNPPFETLVLDEHSITEKIEEEEGSDHNNIFSIEELQHYSLLRLLRKTSDAQKILNKNELKITLFLLTAKFLRRYNSRRKRPAYNEERLESISESIKDSYSLYFLEKINSNGNLSVPDEMMRVLKKKIFDEGPHLRREIILNAVLPLALCLADENSRINLFLWYWSTPALNKYGILTRKFKEFPQNFLWQQQGMLEYIKLHGKKRNIVSESLKEYGFAQILSFYKLGKAPFKSFPDNE